MKRIFLVLAVVSIVLSLNKLSFAGQPDEDKLIEDLYRRGAMTGYAISPTDRAFWYYGDIPYYRPYYWVYYNQQEDSPYKIEVKPAGRILIHVEPSDAQAYIDGRKLQQLPDLTFQAALFAGSHHIDIIKEGYKKFSEDVTIHPAGGLVIPVRLEKTNSATKKKGVVR